MPHRNPKMVHAGTLEALQSQPGPSRRTRPPDIDTVEADENRVPLRSEKVNRRESRLGLRSIFGGRNRLTKEDPSAARPSVYGHAAPQSEPVLGASHFARPMSTMTEVPRPGQAPHQQNSTNAGKQKTATSSKSVRGAMSTWVLPPLFKAFPQAIKHMTLPATSIPADTILRFQERKPNVLTREGPSEQLLVPPNEAGDHLSDKENPKKKHRRNTSASGIKFDWTTKTYVLVTSGYLLQYSGEGTFDRLPEKVLQLGKNSAAFASDVLPGRHWVVQVSSSMEADGTTSPPEPRSLFSRFQFRAAERRQASNFLMVFETAEDMDGWIVTLRREIEALGGKKNLSETGVPKSEEELGQLKQQSSQRTLVLRDPDHLARIGPPPNHWSAQDRDSPDQEGSVSTLTDLEANNDQSLDDISTTNSFVSHDGRQLDNLRDSSNRLSFISSGQRTVVTSAGSSPECSPTTDTFPTRFDDMPLQEEAKMQPETRLRPNAAAILDRRQSMQAMGPFVDLGGGIANMRPQSTYGPTSGLVYSTRAPTPNFSVPHSSSRRFSYARAPPSDSGLAPAPGMGSELSHRWSTRKAPPTTLPIARPLSMVADQPSPMEDVQERPATRHGQDTQPFLSAGEDVMPPPRMATSFEAPSRRPSLIPAEKSKFEVVRPGSSRRVFSMRDRRRSEMPAPAARNFSSPVRPPLGPRTRSGSAIPTNEEPHRCRSSLEVHENSLNTSPGRTSRSKRRASMQSLTLKDKSTHLNIPVDLPTPILPESLPSPLPPPSAPLPPIPTSTTHPLPNRSLLKPDVSEAVLLKRRSMPQLIEGPPLAPPPTCALPPIPQNPSSVQI